MRRILPVLPLLLPSGLAVAQAVAPPQQAAPPPPQNRVIERTAPAPRPRLAPPLQLPEEPRATGPGEAATVRVARIALVGNTALPDAALLPLLAPLDGQTVPLSRIEDARLGILRAYREAGYSYTAVAIGLAGAAGGPPGSAELRVAITEGYVAEVRLDGDIGPAGSLVLKFLDPVLAQRPLTTAALERALLLVSDIPGVAVRGLLRPLPGEAGALQLVAQLARRKVSGYFNLDNRGYELTGAWQGLFVAGANAFTALGERTEVAVLESEANNQTFGQASEEFFAGSSGLRVRLYAGAGRARPGSVLSAIGYRGETRVGGAGVSYPLLRSRPLNLALTAQFDLFESTVDTGKGADSQRASFDSVRALRIGADGSARDTLLPFAPLAAVTVAAIRVSQGIESLGASNTGDGKAARVGSDFGFTKIAAEVTRTQPLWQPLENLLIGVQALLAGQWSNDVLPLSEKFFLGGARLGRGFYSGQVTGDQAWGAAFELQANTGFDLPAPPVLGRWLGESRLGTQFYLFRDIGRAFENQAIDPDRRISSWGGGVRFFLNEWLQVEAEGAHRVIRSPEASGSAVVRQAANAGFARLLVRF
jgi:hemolysin activation/secretion protein